MLTLSVIILNLVLSVQILVLLATIYFLSYVYKNNLNKWYKYASVLLTLFMSGLIICSLVAYTCHGHCYNGNRCEKGSNYCQADNNGHGCNKMQKSCKKSGSNCKMKHGDMEHGMIHHDGIEDKQCKPGCTKPCCANKKIEKKETVEKDVVLETSKE